MSEYGESEEQGEEEDRTVDPPAAVKSSSTGLGSSTDRPHPSGVGGKEKAGGKSMPHGDKPKDPPAREDYDEADRSGVSLGTIQNGLDPRHPREGETQ